MPYSKILHWMAFLAIIGLFLVTSIAFPQEAFVIGSIVLIVISMIYLAEHGLFPWKPLD